MTTLNVLIIMIKLHRHHLLQEARVHQINLHLAQIITLSRVVGTDKNSMELTVNPKTPLLQTDLLVLIMGTIVVTIGAQVPNQKQLEDMMIAGGNHQGTLLRMGKDQQEVVTEMEGKSRMVVMPTIKTVAHLPGLHNNHQLLAEVHTVEPTQMSHPLRTILTVMELGVRRWSQLYRPTKVTDMHRQQLTHHRTTATPTTVCHTVIRRK